MCIKPLPECEEESVDSRLATKRGFVEYLYDAAWSKSVAGSDAKAAVATYLQAFGDCDAQGRRGDAVRQTYTPTAFALVHMENEAGVPERLGFGIRGIRHTAWRRA